MIVEARYIDWKMSMPTQRQMSNTSTEYNSLKKQLEVRADQQMCIGDMWVETLRRRND